MSVQSEIDRIKSNVASAYSVTNDKGGTMPQIQNSENLAATIDSIPTGSVNNESIPRGVIWMWYPESTEAVVPSGWVLCDGTNGTPDLRGRFVLGQSETYSMGSTGGEAEVTLYIHQIPDHFHSVDAGTNSGSVIQRLHIAAALSRANYDGDFTNTGHVGGGQPHNNMPPYYVLAYIMKL